MKGKEIFESYSNIAYSIVGILVWFIPNELSVEYKMLFCFAMQALSAGSFVYHFYKEKPIYLFDWWAMMFVISIISGILADNTYGWVYVVLWQFIYTYFILGRLSVFIEVGMSVLPCLTMVFATKSIPSSLIITAIFLVAFFIRSKDPDPKQSRFHDSWQHGLWHILTSIGLYLTIQMN